MAFVALEKLHKLYDGYRQRVRFAGGDWLLLQEEGRLYCIANRCPHMDAPLHNATLSYAPLLTGSAAAASPRLRCPLHGMEFDLHTGKPVNALACVASLRFMPLVYDANQVGVDL